MILGTAFIEKHIYANLSHENKVAIRKSTPVAVVKQRAVSAHAVCRKKNTPSMDMKTHFE